MIDNLNGNDLFSYSHVDVLLTQLRQMKEVYNCVSLRTNLLIYAALVKYHKWLDHECIFKRIESKRVYFSFKIEQS